MLSIRYWSLQGKIPFSGRREESKFFLGEGKGLRKSNVSPDNLKRADILYLGEEGVSDCLGQNQYGELAPVQYAK
ncbi:MAG: hypothetical protein CV045_00300 [Cyanobacteria bacterium M5B4]|nr:MAG: hypothetical protein CV045_00300 [Cyanobacteria bacterium M5B4]